MNQQARSPRAAPVLSIAAPPPIQPPDPHDRRRSIGRYEILGRLAQGGLAEVWLGRYVTSTGQEKRVAVKTIRPQLARTPEIVELFANEAAIAARFTHPGIVRLVDFGVLEEQPFMAMEYVAGASLRQVGRRLRERRTLLPVPLVVSVLAEVCGALSYAHSFTENGRPLGFVHNDLSPENIMLSADGAVKLIDFGAARIDVMPPTTRFVGKYRYTSPERLRGERADARSDVFSLGVVLFEYLTGTKPFAGDDKTIIAQVLAGHTLDPRTRAHVPDDLAGVVMRAMAPRREHRHPTTAALEADLRQHLRAGMYDEHVVPSQWAVALQPMLDSQPISLLPRRDTPPVLELVRNESFCGPASTSSQSSIELDIPGIESVVASLDREADPQTPPDARGALPQAELWAAEPSSAAQSTPMQVERPNPFSSTPARTLEPPSALSDWGLSAPRAPARRASVFSTDLSGDRLSAQRAFSFVTKETLTARAAPPDVSGRVTATADAQAQRASRHFDAGWEKLRANDTAGALSEWQRAAELEPENRRHQVNLAKLRRRMEGEGKPR